MYESCLEPSFVLIYNKTTNAWTNGGGGGLATRGSGWDTGVFGLLIINSWWGWQDACCYQIMRLGLANGSRARNLINTNPGLSQLTMPVWGVMQMRGGLWFGGHEQKGANRPSHPNMWNITRTGGKKKGGGAYVGHDKNEKLGRWMMCQHFLLQRVPQLTCRGFCFVWWTNPVKCLTSCRSWPHKAEGGHSQRNGMTIKWNKWSVRGNTCAEKPSNRWVWGRKWGLVKKKRHKSS